MIASAKTRPGELSSLVKATTWLNSQPLTAAELDGKIVLVDSGRIPASTGGANFLTFEHGQKSTRITDWW